jgi:bis(5'-nucleosidyl)-tetraphosphatase
MRKNQSSGIIIIRYENLIPKVLLLKAYNFWDFPKGGMENSENKLETALREVKEETGITHLDFKWGKCYYETEPFGKNEKTVFYFMANTDSEEVNICVNPISGKIEHDEYKWVTFEEAKKMTVYRIQKAIFWAEKRLYCFNINKIQRKRHDRTKKNRA